MTNGADVLGFDIELQLDAVAAVDCDEFLISDTVLLGCVRGALDEEDDVACCVTRGTVTVECRTRFAAGGAIDVVCCARPLSLLC